MEANRLAWGAKVPPEFRDRVVRMARDLGDAVDPSWIMAAMHFETGGTFDPAKRNPASSATGLIQFMASTARDLNTTTDALARMSQLEQLDYVARYFHRFAGRLRSLSDVYMAILWPVAVGKRDEEVIFASATDAYIANRGLDFNRDGAVTKGEATEFVARRLAEGLLPANSTPIPDPSVSTDAPTPAPIHDVSTPARREDLDRILQPYAGDTTMAAPIALILPLIQSLFSIFTPLAQQKLTKAIDKQVGDPTASQQMSQQILDAVRQTLQQAGIPIAPPATPAAPGTGVAAADDLIAAADAVAKVKANPQLASQVQAAVEPIVDKVLIDSLSAAEQSAWDAEEASRNAAAARASQAADDGFRSPTFLIGIAMLGLPYIAVTRVLFGDGFSEQLQTVVVTAAVTGILGYIGGFYFGTTRNSAAKDAIMGQIATRRSNT
jgi:hypothetical protein